MAAAPYIIGQASRFAVTRVGPMAVALTLLIVSAAPALGQEPPSNTAIERALESRAKGGDEASVVVFEIADFQCPYCARFAREVAPELDRKYVETGRVKWVFVNLPLHTHPLAWLAAEAALCAGVAGGHFWPMHDRLFATQAEWGRAADPAARFATMARELGVDEEAYRACVVRDQVAPLIVQDLGSAISAGVSGTPTFIIMRGQEVVDQLVGVQPVETWSQVLDPLFQ